MKLHPTVIGYQCAALLLLISVSAFSQNSLQDLFNNLASNRSRSSMDNSKEVIYVLNNDGRKFVQFDGVRSGDNLHLLTEKGEKPSDSLYFFPPGVRVKSYDAKSNYFDIPPGGYSSMYSGSLALKEETDGSFTYKPARECSTYAGKRRCGIWHESGFDNFALAFVLPDNIVMQRWKTNVDGRGRWAYKHPVLQFIATNVNQISFEVNFRIRKSAVQDMETLP